ncbi:MAG: 5-carboxymethyl-2-hydroxymuconate Delta-isomerase [Alphaproteobacteria bacterium]
MPHIIVEYCDTLTALDVPKLVMDLHEDLGARESVDIHGIKSRAIPVQYVLVGDQKDYNKLIHITLKLLPGRSDELKREMAQGLADIAHKSTHDDRVAVTCEVTELHAESYIK